MAQLLCSCSIKSYAIVKTNVFIITYGGYHSGQQLDYLKYFIFCTAVRGIDGKHSGVTIALRVIGRSAENTCTICSAILWHLLLRTNFQISQDLSLFLEDSGCSSGCRLEGWRYLQRYLSERIRTISIQIWDRNWIVTLWTKIFLAFVTLTFLETIFMTVQ